jgi:flagellum-specific peptidoglycan hydrolase FlgJ
MNQQNPTDKLASELSRFTDIINSQAKLGRSGFSQLQGDSKQMAAQFASELERVIKHVRDNEFGDKKTRDKIFDVLTGVRKDLASTIQGAQLNPSMAAALANAIAAKTARHVSPLIPTQVDDKKQKAFLDAERRREEHRSSIEREYGNVAKPFRAIAKGYNKVQRVRGAVNTGFGVLPTILSMPFIGKLVWDNVKQAMPDMPSKEDIEQSMGDLSKPPLDDGGAVDSFLKKMGWGKYKNEEQKALEKELEQKAKDNNPLYQAYLEREDRLAKEQEEIKESGSIFQKASEYINTAAESIKTAAAEFSSVYEYTPYSDEEKSANIDEALAEIKRWITKPLNPASTLPLTGKNNLHDTKLPFTGKNSLWNNILPTERLEELADVPAKNQKALRSFFDGITKYFDGMLNYFGGFEPNTKSSRFGVSENRLALTPRTPESSKSSQVFKPGSFNPTENFNRAVNKASELTGIDPRIIATQLGLETRDGKATVGDYNFGNIKAFKSWKGRTVGLAREKHNDPANEDPGITQYRAYDSPEHFAQDWARLMKKMYPNAIGAKDLDTFSNEMVRVGYATDPRYKKKLANKYKSVGNDFKVDNKAEDLPPRVSKMASDAERDKKIDEMLSKQSQIFKDTNNPINVPNQAPSTTTDDVMLMLLNTPAISIVN